MGEAALAADDRRYLAFATDFEREFIGQSDTRRTITETFDLAWRLLAPFPDDELTRISPELLAVYRPPRAARPGPTVTRPATRKPGFRLMYEPDFANINP